MSEAQATGEAVEAKRAGRARVGAMVLLALACAWIVAARIPLVLNAPAHLDSDMAVDGLTLLDATRGHWRWHYPGTPHIGIVPVVFSLPQALVWGANPWTLASGGVVAYLFVVVSIFTLAWRVFGRRVACWTLLPLVFASTGVVWLSARITGGHLLAVAWTAVSLILLVAYAQRPTWWRAAILGLWAGVGFYVDNLTLVAIAAIFCGFSTAAFTQEPLPDASGRVRAGPYFLRALFQIVVGIAAVVAGIQLQTLGKRADPYDAYGEQFESIFHSDSPQRQDLATVGKLAQEHARLLFLECLPRLVAGHRLPGLQTNPTPEAFLGHNPPRDPPVWTPLAIAATVLSLVVSVIGVGCLFRAPRVREACRARSLAARRAFAAPSWFMLLFYPIGFILNKHIYNSDNYRYLVILIIPISIGVGLWFERFWGRGGWWRGWALAGAVLFAVLMTFDLWTWYGGRFGWVDARGLPVRARVDEPILEWLSANPEYDEIFANYWDIYRLRFLTGGRVGGVPYKNYPDRFDERRHLPNERPRTLVGRRDGMGAFYRQQALRAGGRVIHEQPEFWVIDWP